MNYPPVTVIMSNYNGIDLNLLPQAISSILENEYPNLEVILVDNASTDKSIETVKKLFGNNKKLKIIQNPVNIYSKGLNLGLKETKSKYVAFFNNDVFVEKKFFQKFMKFLEGKPNIALSQGKIVSYYDHKVIDCVGETMDRFGNPISIGAGQNAKKNFRVELEVLSVSGSCSILRKSAISKIGLFDEDYGIGYEDLDLALRAHLVGFKVVYYPNAYAFHIRAATDVDPKIRAKVKWHFNKNRLSTMIKNYPLSLLVFTLPVTLLIYFFAGLTEAFIKGSISVGIARLTAIFWVIKHLPQLIHKRKLVQITKITDFRVIERLFYKNIFLISFLTFLKIREPK